ncbi:MAG: endonuclease/exonuclease/phosphatase family protein, partial [Verrucomicrobiota bacterium]|nr:endonuclease/exonuclease/phosphatase family protein [Verrucomicrobiota bacterium]
TLFVVVLCIGYPMQGETKEPTLRVMSYNIHRGGVVMRKQPLSQTAKAIRLAKADIVGIQETRSPRGDKFEELATLLGWNHDMGKGSQILTRYEIVDSLYRGVKVKLDSGSHAYVFNVHLASHPYQPYQLLEIRPRWHKHTNDLTFIKTEAEAIEWANKARGAEIAKVLRQIKSLPDKKAPVFVVGDFNEPSHLDWTEAAAKAGRHPIKVEYPNSLAMKKAGFSDAYRTLYPDEMKNPGYTWSSFYKFDDPTTHHDRIDFVYFKGSGLTVKDIRIVGENKKDADIVISPYPSDHRAVVATLELSK